MPNRDLSSTDHILHYPNWKKYTSRLSRPITKEDIQSVLGNEDIFIRDAGAGPIHIIHKYGLLEIHALFGNNEIEVWFNPDQGAHRSEYLDALLATRFYAI